MKIVKMLILIAQTMHFGVLNADQETPTLLEKLFLKTIKKKLKQCDLILQKMFLFQK